MMRKYPTRDEIIEEADDKQWLQRQRLALTDDYEGVVTESSHQQPVSATVDAIEKQSDLFPRYSFAVVTGRYKILDNRSDGPTRITQIATADGEVEARTIVNALNADVQYLANRAEELSSLLAGMTTERDGLREVLRQVRGFVCEATWKPSSAGSRRAESLIKVIDAALNHAEQGEGSAVLRCGECGIEIDRQEDHRIPAGESTSGVESWLGICRYCLSNTAVEHLRARAVRALRAQSAALGTERDKYAESEMSITYLSLHNQSLLANDLARLIESLPLVETEEA